MNSIWRIFENKKDDVNRVVQAKSTNISGGTDITTTQYDFSGKVLRNHVAHQKSGANNNTYQVLTKMSYDVGGRLLTVKKRVNNNSTNITTDKTIVENSYDELGQLKKKILGNSVDYVEYDYNISANNRVSGEPTGLNINDMK